MTDAPLIPSDPDSEVFACEGCGVSAQLRKLDLDGLCASCRPDLHLNEGDLMALCAVVVFSAARMNAEAIQFRQVMTEPDTDAANVLRTYLQQRNLLVRS